MTLKHSPGVLEVLIGIGFGGGDAGKRLVEDADDPLLFGEGWERDLKISNLRQRKILLRDAAFELLDLF